MMVYLIAAVIAALDQSVKWLIVTHLAPGQSIPVWRGVVELLYVQNPGAAWSMFPNQRILLIAVALVVAGVIVYVDRRHARGKYGLQAALGALLGGAAGNLIDRLFRGYVVDYVYIQIIHYPVFNLADSAVVLSVLYLIIRAWRARPEASQTRDGGRLGDGRAAPDTGAGIHPEAGAGSLPDGDPRKGDEANRS